MTKPEAESFASLLITVLVLIGGFVSTGPAGAAPLKVMSAGLGSGAVTSDVAGINCGADCDESYGAVTVTLTATAATGSSFVQWLGDCSGATCALDMSAERSVRAEFALTTVIPTIADFTPAGLALYLTANPQVNSPARFLKALPADFKQNWLMMSRSESLQTGTAEMPRFLLPNADTRYVFTFGLAENNSYPGANPDAIEYMQFDDAEKNFRFHEIVLSPIPAMGAFPARTRGVSIDDPRCTKCHSTRNVRNPGTTHGTTGIPPGTVKWKNKPNWDTYDSWGGMLPFNRDRIYQGSVEAAAFRRLLNPWTWRADSAVRSLIEQLELQPPGIPAQDAISRLNGGANDGRIRFFFDGPSPVLTEPPPVGTSTDNIPYSFGGVATPGTPVQRGGTFLTLHHSGTPTFEEGRAVQFFDLLGGADGDLNQRRIGDELANHRYVTGGVPLDVRPIALAITKGCLSRTGNTVTPALSAGLAFFTARHGGLTIDQIYNDTLARSQALPRRKADIEKLNLDRTGDVYLARTPTPATTKDGLIQTYGSATSAGTSTSMSRLRQEVFRRPVDAGEADAITGFYVDREDYPSNTGTDFNTERVAMYRYFLEPLGVSVDKWSMGVRGRSRTYTFADVFDGFRYVGTLTSELEASLNTDPFPGLSAPYNCPSLITAVDSAFSALPAANAVPTYTDVQRIFNKGCIECHGGLDYPPFSEFFDADYLDLSEDEDPAAASRLRRSHTYAKTFTTTNPATSYLFQRITELTEECPNGVMPCGGPPLAQADIDTIRRWILGGQTYSEGDPHIKTVDGINYDFQSAGEFVLLRGEDLEIQARQTAVPTQAPLGPNAYTGLSSCVSINTAVAVRVGQHRIAYQPMRRGDSESNSLQLRVDGKLTQMGAEIVLSTGGRILPTTEPGGIQIEYPGGTDIVITPGWWEHHQVSYLNIDVRHARATEGVMGTVAPGNWLPALPDNTLLGPRPADLHQRYQHLYVKFADAWRVTDQNSLFDYLPGMSTATFSLASWPGLAPQTCLMPPSLAILTKTALEPLALEAAQQHCSAVVEDDRRANCEQDVMITGEPGFARSYLATERILLNPIPTAPLLVFPEDDQTDVSTPVTFDWQRSTDATGDDLTYRHCIWATGTTLTFDGCRELPRESALPEGSKAYLWAALLICLLLAIILYLRTRSARIPLGLLAIATLIAIMLALPFGRGTETLSHTVAELDRGRGYFWKVIAQDGKGGNVESATRRFATRR